MITSTRIIVLFNLKEDLKIILQGINRQQHRSEDAHRNSCSQRQCYINCCGWGQNRPMISYACRYFWGPFIKTCMHRNIHAYVYADIHIYTCIQNVWWAHTCTHVYIHVGYIHMPRCIQTHLGIGRGYIAHTEEAGVQIFKKINVKLPNL